MDRALRVELLAGALTDARNLPTAEELRERLAEAEVGLVRGIEGLGRDLIEVGWYLHGVASSDPALELYGVERQRRAYQVSAHIFDLALTDPGLSLVERLRLAFACQVAYWNSDLDPNALAIYRQRVERRAIGLIDDAETVAMQVGAAVLGGDAEWLWPQLRRLRNEARTLEQEWEVESLHHTVYGAAAGVIDGAYELLIYLTFGAEDRLERATEMFKRAASSDPAAGDLDSRWVAAHLLRFSRGVERASPWSVLPPDVPDAVKRSLTSVAPPVLTMWPPQLEALQAGRLFDPANRRVILSLPTSAGKSLLAQVLVLAHVATGEGDVCYVAPTRALCREVRQGLRGRLRIIRHDVQFESADWDPVPRAAPTPGSVEVMTPERLQQLLRSDSEEVLDRFGLFIIDEAHSVGDGLRGWTLESVISALHELTLATHHRIVLMSAALGNRAHFSAWIDPEGEGESFHSDWRGPRRLHCIYTAEPDWDAVRVEPRRSRRYPRRRIYPQYGTLRLRVADGARIHGLKLTEPVGELALLERPDGTRDGRERERSTPLYRMIAPLAVALGEAGPVLLISPTRSDSRRLALAIAELIDDEVDELVEYQRVISTLLGDDHPLVGPVRKGVAYHHASLPIDVLTLIEDGVRDEQIRFLVATTTLTEGVNLPVRTVIITATGTYAQGGDFEEYIVGPRLLNAVGRAGRAARETEGWLVLARSARFHLGDFDRLRPTEEELQVRSLLATDAALEMLARVEAEQRAVVDLIFEDLDKAGMEFSKFVWSVAARIERHDRLPTVEDIRIAFESTLAWQQLDDEHRERWLALAIEILQSYVRTDARIRRRWASSGLSLPDAAALQVIADETLDRVRTLTGAEQPAELLEFVLGDGVLERIMHLPGAPDRRFWTSTGRNREEVPVDLARLLGDWVAGEEVNRIAEAHLARVPRIEYRLEQLGDFVSEVFEMYVPWVLSTLLNWFNSTFSEEGTDLQLPLTPALLVRYGVSTPSAVELMSRGVLSRRLATRIGETHQADDTDEDVVEWLRAMDLVEWARRFEATTHELRNLLEVLGGDAGGVLGRVLENERAAIAVLPRETAEGPAEVRLLPDDPEPKRLGVWVADRCVAVVSPEYQTDLMGLIRTGLPLRLEYRVDPVAGAQLLLALLEEREL